MSRSPSPDPIRVLFVCLGNVCRSPTAAGLFMRHVREARLERRFEVDSAGTGGHFAGRSPDPRAQAVAQRYGVDLSGMRARTLAERDFERFDYIIAMDEGNLRDVRARARPTVAGGGPRIELLKDGALDRSIPDPYEGGPGDFTHMIEGLQSGTAGLLERLRRDHGL